MLSRIRVEHLLDLPVGCEITALRSSRNDQRVIIIMVFVLSVQE